MDGRAAGAAWLHVDSADHDGQPCGWAANPSASNDGRRGPVYLAPEFAPGFSAELRTRVRAEDIEQR